METIPQISAEDRARAEQVLAYYDGPRSVSELLGRWESAIDTIEDEAVNTIFYVISDLEIRNIIDRVLQIISLEGREALQTALSPVDNRFLQATREISLSHSLSEDDLPNQWWWYRIPRQAGTNLAAWMESQSYLEYLRFRTSLDSQLERLQFSVSDSVQIERILAHSTTPTVHALIRKWARVVTEIEYFYDFGIEDYWNDLCVRDVLEEVAQAVSSEGRQALMSVLHSLDERFLQATYDIPEPLWKTEPWEQWGFLPHSPEGFWWYRVPKRAGEELTEWLKAFLDNR